VYFLVTVFSGEITTAQHTNCPRLPPELIAEIFDRLYGNKKALAVCSLVCRSWTRLARHRLFEDVTINFYSGVLKLRKVLEAGSAAMPFIRRLSLSPSFGNTAIFYNEVIVQLGGLEHIRSLSLAYFDWRILKPEVTSAFFAHFSIIVRLQLQVRGEMMLSELETIICGLPRLEILVFTTNPLLILHHSNPPPSALCFPRNLRKLELRVRETNTFLKWLLSFPTTPALRTVYLHGGLPEGINSFLQALGPSLEVFRCDTYGEAAVEL
jgi:hypothetical protein